MSVIFCRIEPTDKATFYRLILRESPTSPEKVIMVHWTIAKAFFSAQEQARDEIRDAIKGALRL